MTKRFTSILLIVVLCFSLVPFALAADTGMTEEERNVITEQSQKHKVNTILTCDGECDDIDSFMRYLNYANEFNTKAIVYGSSQWHSSGGTIIDPATGLPAHYDEAVHGTPGGSGWKRNPVNPYAFDPTPEDPDNGDEYMALAYDQNRWNGFGWIGAFLTAYEESYENLSSHDPDYPTPEYIESITAIGNIKAKGDMLEVTEGSELIKNTILENPHGEDLYIQVWGGSNCVARALLSIEEEYNPEYNENADQADWDALYDQICSDVVLYIIQDQDGTTNSYIKPVWDITYLNSTKIYNAFGYGFNTLNGKYVYTDAEGNTQEVFSAAWCEYMKECGNPLTKYYLNEGTGWDLRNIGLNGTDEAAAFALSKGLSNATYEASLANPYNTWSSELSTGFTKDFYDAEANPLNAWPDDEKYIFTWGESENRGKADWDDPSKHATGTGNFISEGDSPSYMFLIDNGLRGYENFGWGGWGGRFTPANDGTNNWNDSATDYNPFTNQSSNSNTQYRWNPDIQADWSARAQWTIADSSNDAPMSGVMNGLDITAVPGETITLNGVAYDPDGDDLSYAWWQYFEADTYDGAYDNALVMSGADTKDLTVTIPKDAQKGDTIHLIFETQDSAQYPMKAYKRVVVTVGGVDVALSGKTVASTADNVLSYTLSAANLYCVNAVEVTFEIDTAFTGQKIAKALNGFSILDQAWTTDPDTGKTICSITMVAFTPVTSRDALDIADLQLVNQKGGGTATVSVTGAKFASDGDTYMDVTFVNDSVTTVVGVAYDVNGDGIVDLLDISAATLVYGAKANDADYSAAADVNADGIIDLTDLMLIKLNYT